MKNTLRLICFLSVIAWPVRLISQVSQNNITHKISGRIFDKTTNEPLIGVNILYGKAKGVLTDINGDFSVNLPNGAYTLQVIYIGYTPINLPIEVKGSDLTIEPLTIAISNELDEVEIVADIARTRETPIAFSDIEAKQISEEIGANDITMLLNATPGAYASQQGGGAGDSRVNIRGFDQRYISVLVDGVPVNDMENGQVYWSNWSGLSEVTKKMQVQRGLGASRLAVPSIGGVMNIITKSVEQQQFFVIKNDLGTNNYRRIGIGYNSGLLKNKFGITLSGSYTGGDGFVDQTWQKTWSYFAKVSYRINNKNLIVLGFNGAPQSHGQRSFAINPAFHDRTFANKNGINADSIYYVTNSSNPYTNSKAGSRGIAYSPDWGYVNGRPVNTKVNFFHKPLVNLSYFLTVNPRVTFSNVLYLSLGNGGGTALASYGSGYDGAGTGQLSMQGIYNTNFAARPNLAVSDLRPSSNYIFASINNHKWVGTLSTLNYKFANNLDFIGGVDARYYNGEHYQTPYDYLGGDYVPTPGGRDLNLPILKDDSTAYVKKIGDKINYYYDSKITWLGLFTQLEYKTEKATAFITITGNQSTYQNINYFNKRDIVLDKNDIVYRAVGTGDTLYYDGTNYGVSPTNYANPGAYAVTKNPDGGITFYDAITKKNVTLGPNYTTYDNNSTKARTNTSKVKIYSGYTIKGGTNYKLDANNNVFVNLGYMNNVPKFSNVYDRSGVEISGVQNQIILSAELGYGIKYRDININLNGYITKWGNKPLDFAQQLLDPNSQDPVYYNVPGVDALLKGFEMDLLYKPTDFVEAQLFGTIADWRWNSGGTSYVFSQTGTPLDTVVFDAKNVHIGNAPQLQIGGSLRFKVFKGIYIKPQYIYFDKMYAQFDPTSLRVSRANDFRQIDSWRMPGYGLLNMFVGYEISSKKTIVNITASMNNVLDVVYMTDASFASAVTPNNFNALNSRGWMGLGRRITVGVKVTF